MSESGKNNFLHMPEFGAGINSVVFLRWLVKPGSIVYQDQPLYEVETQKSVLQVESPYNCKIIKYLCNDNDQINAFEKIAKIEIMDQINNKDNLQDNIKSFHHYEIKSENHSIFDFSKKQKDFINSYRQNKAIQSTINFYLEENKIEKAKENLLKTNALSAHELLLTTSSLLLYILKKAADGLPFCKKIPNNDNGFYELDKNVLGIAVADNLGEFDIAVLPISEEDDKKKFFSALHLVMQNPDKYSINISTKEIPNIIFSYAGEIPYFGGTPLLISPSIMTIFLGGGITLSSTTIRVLSISFDHRTINGIHVAQLINKIYEILNLLTFTSHENNHLNHNCKNDFVKTKGFLHKKTSVQTIIEKIISSYINIKKGLSTNNIPMGALGLNSLSATKMISQINEKLNLNIPVTAIWKYPTTSRLIQYILTKSTPNEN